jgi:hypothetical protein
MLNTAAAQQETGDAAASAGVGRGRLTKAKMKKLLSQAVISRPDDLFEAFPADMPEAREESAVSRKVRVMSSQYINSRATPERQTDRQAAVTPLSSDGVAVRGGNYSSSRSVTRSGSVVSSSGGESAASEAERSRIRRRQAGTSAVQSTPLSAQRSDDGRAGGRGRALNLRTPQDYLDMPSADGKRRLTRSAVKRGRDNGDEVDEATASRFLYGMDGSPQVSAAQAEPGVWVAAYASALEKRHKMAAREADKKGTVGESSIGNSQGAGNSTEKRAGKNTSKAGRRKAISVKASFATSTDIAVSQMLQKRTARNARVWAPAPRGKMKAAIDPVTGRVVTTADVSSSEEEEVSASDDSDS